MLHDAGTGRAMTRPKALVRVEKMALEGDMESLDSQAIFDAHRAMFAVDGFSSSPPAARWSVKMGVGQPPGRRPEAARADVEQATAADEAPVIQNAPPLDHASPVMRQDTLPERPMSAVAPTRRMNTSQQTPTQLNTPTQILDGEYAPLCAILTSTPVPESTTHDAGDEPRTLQQGDTGAVDFGHLSDVARLSSQVSEDEGFDATRGDWRASDGTSQLHSHPTYTPSGPHGLPPETPAVAKNPFVSVPIISAPLVGSQLFGQTQQLSWAAKLSPTSSRPSPDHPLPNSIWSNALETSPLKNRTNLSSPTDIPKSSPERLHQVPGTLPEERSGEIVQHSPVNDRLPGDELIPESPTYQVPRPHLDRQPLSHYEPMKQSQERKAKSGVRPLDLNPDNDHDDALKKLGRRRRAERKRARAAEEMEKVSFARPSRRGSAAQPSRKKRRLNEIDENTTGHDGAAVSSRAKSRDPAGAGDSQNEPVPPSLEATSVQSTKATPGEDGAVTERAALGTDEPPQKQREPRLVVIPVTSPMQSPSTGTSHSMPPSLEPELPILAGQGGKHRTQRDTTMQTSTPPVIRPQMKRVYGVGARKARRSLRLTSSTSEAPRVEPGDKIEQDVPVLQSAPTMASTARPKVTCNNVADRGSSDGEMDGEPQVQMELPPRSSHEASVCDLAQARGSDGNLVTPMHPRGSEAVVPPSSSLTVLSVTPVPSSTTTPGTEQSLPCDRPGHLDMAASVSSMNLRKRTLRAVTICESPRPGTLASRITRRSARFDSDSTDELHRSPRPSTDRSISLSRSSKSCPQSIGANRGGRRLFEGMAFALSSQSNKAEQQRTRLESQITQAGGAILKNGFTELFEQSAMTNAGNAVLDGHDALKLLRASLGCGFTALIADGHSRKPKYMQALALGLPCLGHQWITACFNRGKVVDWEPYLLCAGSSAVLGNAIRSRVLASYPAVDARLEDVIERRRRLLRGQSVLMVVDAKKERDERKQQFMFLVQALGPSAISRVSTAQQARVALRESERAGRRFDWLYIDTLAGTAESVLRAKQRKKAASGTAPKREDVGVLTDEVVIQSLILGRMMEPGEMDLRAQRH